MAKNEDGGIYSHRHMVRLNDQQQAELDALLEETNKSQPGPMLRALAMFALEHKDEFKKRIIV